MKKKKANTIWLGLVLVGLGVYFDNWLGVIGILPLLLGAVDWLHGLFTYREMRLQ